MAQEILTKRILLNILEQIEMDDPVRVKVNIEHLERKAIKPDPNLLDSDIEMLTKTGWANLSVGAGLGGVSGGVTLSTTHQKNQ